MKYIKQADGTWKDVAMPALQLTKGEKDDIMKTMYTRYTSDTACCRSNSTNDPRNHLPCVQSAAQQQRRHCVLESAGLLWS